LFLLIISHPRSSFRFLVSLPYFASSFRYFFLISLPHSLLFCFLVPHFAPSFRFPAIPHVASSFLGAESEAFVDSDKDVAWQRLDENENFPRTSNSYDDYGDYGPEDVVGPDHPDLPSL
jgi:hypothetical protein